MKAYIVERTDVRKNLDNIKKRAGSAEVIAVLKGDGYGLGLIPMAAVCREAGITRFAVTEIADVRALREAGFADAWILMLRPTADSDEIHSLLDLGAVLTVSSQDDAAVLNGIAAQRGQKAEAHLKIDTGMGRNGFLPSGRHCRHRHLYASALRVLQQKADARTGRVLSYGACRRHRRRV